MAQDEVAVSDARPYKDEQLGVLASSFPKRWQGGERGDVVARAVGAAGLDGVYHQGEEAGAEVRNGALQIQVLGIKKNENSSAKLYIRYNCLV